LRVLTCCTTIVARGVVQTELIGFEVKFILPFILLLTLLLVLLATALDDDDDAVVVVAFVLFLQPNDDVADFSFWQSSKVFSHSPPRENVDDATSDGDSAKKSIFKSGMGDVGIGIAGCS
jgi:hypothetical protein